MFHWSLQIGPSRAQGQQYWGCGEILLLPVLCNQSMEGKLNKYNVSFSCVNISPLCLEIKEYESANYVIGLKVILKKENKK